MTFRMRPLAFVALTACLLPAPPAAAKAQDSPQGIAVVDQGRQIMPNELMEALVGWWEGTCRTWLEPGKLADETKVRGEIRPLLGGLFVRHEYESAFQGRPRHGEEMIAFNAMTGRFQVAWIDDFHMSEAIMFSEGEATARGFTVMGKYDVADGPPWGWKTVYELADNDHLLITAYNILPDGQEAKAVETVYFRAKDMAGKGSKKKK